MRIIAGRLRGRKLASIKGTDIRPTADRIREALFNILARKPHDSMVLDLYCGTGALGLEALSRGAAYAFFVDEDPRSLAVARRNIVLCRMENHSRVIRWDIRKNLHCLSAGETTFDLVFMDPPYGQSALEDTLRHLTGEHLLKPDALVVAEHEPAENIDPGRSGFRITDRRRYGRTGLTFLREDRAVDKETD